MTIATFLGGAIFELVDGINEQLILADNGAGGSTHLNADFLFVNLRNLVTPGTRINFPRFVDGYDSPFALHRFASWQ